MVCSLRRALSLDPNICGPVPHLFEVSVELLHFLRIGCEVGVVILALQAGRRPVRAAISQYLAVASQKFTCPTVTGP